jgi:predicted RNA binding protein YcfA (HicA-like mRNA interferase family)
VARLPSVRPREVVAALGRAGFSIHHQTGSHAVLRHDSDGSLRVTVPMHGGDLKRGTLRAILRQADLSPDDFVRLL